MGRTRSPLLPLAQGLRKASTDAERKLWRHLKDRQLGGCKFRRQYPIGNYIADFICVEARLIVELDGGQHTEQGAADQARTEYLISKGYRVMRFWNDQMLKETDAVLSEILRALEAPSPLPLVCCFMLLLYSVAVRLPSGP